VEEDVAFGPENLGLSTNEIRQRVDSALKKVSMEDFAQHPPLLLSGGQKQRVAIAGILAMKPKYMVLDEPTSMLDTRGRREVIDILIELKEKEGITLVLTTHDPGEIIRADRVIVLDKGKLIFQGSPELIVKEVELLKDMGIEPMEISTIIKTINSQMGSAMLKQTYDIRVLVDELCQLR
jgi:energy-coupling factor transport system ATP-binding protein